MKTRIFVLLILSLLTMLLIGLSDLDTNIQTSPYVEIDVCATIYKVVDGDTFDAFPVGRVRLADIDAPELDTTEGQIAKQALQNLVSTYGSKVYLDVDDLYVMDKYNRIVAVAYLRYNSTHVLNVNKWLLDNGYAVIDNYPNEFSPYTWSLFEYLPYDPCVSGTTVTTTKTVTKTDTVTITSTLTNTVTTTKATTVTVPTTYTTYIPTTTTVRETTTIRETVTSPTTTTFTLITPSTTTLTTTSTTTLRETTTIVAVDWTTTGVIAVVLLVIGIAIGYIIKRK